MIGRISLFGAAALYASVAVAGPAPDVAAGKKWFGRTCEKCHSTQIGVNKVGPSLHGIVGRKVASIPDYDYSKSMKEQAEAGSGTWSVDALNAYIANPRGDVHGVKMFYKGLKSERDRANVIGYLKTLN